MAARPWCCRLRRSAGAEMRSRINAACVAAVLACATPSFAFTGAEFLQADRSFAAGYAWGAMDAQLYTADKGSPDSPTRRLQCVIDSKITSGTFYESVSAQIRADPSLLKTYALSAIYVTLFKMCGPY